MQLNGLHVHATCFQEDAIELFVGQDDVSVAASFHQLTNRRCQLAECIKCCNNVMGLQSDLQKTSTWLRGYMDTDTVSRVARSIGWNYSAIANDEPWVSEVTYTPDVIVAK